MRASLQRAEVSSGGRHAPRRDRRREPAAATAAATVRAVGRAAAAATSGRRRTRDVGRVRGEHRFYARPVERARASACPRATGR